MKPKIWTEVNLHPEALTRLQAKTEVITSGALDNLPGAEVAIIGRSTVDDAFLDQAGPQLEMVIRHGIGYNAVDVPAANKRGVLAANTPDSPTESTAEHEVALMLSMTKRVVKSDGMSQGVVDQILQLFAGEQPSSLIDPAAWPGRAGS